MAHLFFARRDRGRGALLAAGLYDWYLIAWLTVPGAWIVAAVFAVHPLHMESVAWVIERKAVLSGIFYLAASSACSIVFLLARARFPTYIFL